MKWKAECYQIGFIPKQNKEKQAEIYCRWSVSFFWKMCVPLLFSENNNYKKYNDIDHKNKKIKRH